MKNLSAIHRLSLLETFTILITLVVCLAGFTEAEGNANFKKQDSNQPKEENYLQKEALYKENTPYYQQSARITNERRNFDDVKNLAVLPADNFVKRESEDFGESDESDQKEGDGYGYDDDEYYHLNMKRSETNSDSKAEKEGVHELNDKEGINAQKKPLGLKDKTKDGDTIEMLNFKESHLNMGLQMNSNSNENSKTFNEETARKKTPNSPVITSLKMSDLRENSAIDEKMKDRKDESSLSGSSSDTKLTDVKKQTKTIDEKDSIKLKDTQIAEDSEKKEKETSLKDGKEVAATKTLKDTPEEKEKSAKLSESVKLEDTIDKISSKTKETDSPKIAKDEAEESKVASELINSNVLSQMSNRASFVNNDFKDNAEVVKAAEAVEDENSGEMAGMDANVRLNNYQEEDLRRSRERLRQLYNVRNIESGTAHLRDNPKIFRHSNNPKESLSNSDFQNLNPNDLFLKRDWKGQEAENMKFRLEQQQQQNAQEQQFTQDEQQSPQEQVSNQQEQKPNSIFNNQLKNSYGLTFPANEIENTDYHKNFIKSLKRYKSLSNEQKNVLPEPSNTNTNDKTNVDVDMKNLKKELKEPMKRRSISSEEPNKRLKFRRNSPNNGKSLPSDSESCILEPQSSQSSPKLTKDTKMKDNNRIRRKSQKVEYEIKVFNQNQPGDKNAELSQGSKRFEKDIKVKTHADKYSKKYPYSQASKDDLTRITDVDGGRKFKRKAPITKRHDQKSVIQTRAVPSGYYGNRVKFGQKNYARNNERNLPEAFRQTHIPQPALTGQAQAANDKNKMLRSWEVLPPNYRHESIKRFDATGSANKGNSLLLVRKGDRITTAFEEGSPRSDSELNPDNLAKILSNNNDYIVLKKTESNKFQKMSESNPPLNDYNAASCPITYSAEEEQQENQKNEAQQTVKNKGLFVRASLFEKDKKSPSGFRTSKSNLKKTFAKFRDLAGFFKDNEQESTDNQYPTQELKEGRDIVFSEDKRPDPIVINSDMNEKNYNQKPFNSIYSISNNFKTLDQPDKKSDAPSGSESGQNMFTAEAKSDGIENAWGSTIKSLFPEAKTVNSISRNGNEIIVLDLNRNLLKPINHISNSAPKASNPKTQLGAFGFTSQIPSGKDKKAMFIMGSNVQQEPNSLSPLKTPLKTPLKAPLKTIGESNRAYTLVKASQSQPNQLEGLPNLLKALLEMKSTSSKAITKRSPAQNKVSENYNKFLRDLNELSELNKSSYKKAKLEKKRDTFLPPSSFPELSNYGDANIKYLGSLLQNIMTRDNSQFKALNEDAFGMKNSKYSEENPKSNQLNAGGLDAERNLKYQGKWSVEEDKSKDTPENKGENDFEASGERSYQEKLWDELAATSDKINRLRREGAGKRKLRKAIEDSLDFKQKSGANAKDSKLNSGVNLNGDSDAKERSEIGTVKSEYEEHLNELFENLNKNQKNQLNLPNESTWKRKKRKGNQRRKRSPGVDNMNKVSTTTAVQILKTLPEDNYQSVYSPGIKRTLLSTKNEADNPDNYSDAYEHDRDVTSEKNQANCVKNKLNNCVDPIIVELFKGDDMEEERPRARRSLNAGFHSNFKREIDLDESMPNDFQSFLVTSLGGFGSQKREVMKKDDALWEGKATSQDGSGIGEYGLEKRDVSSSEKRKSSTFKNEFYPPGSSSEMDVMGSLHHTEKKVRSDESSKLKGKSEFVDEKLPTQIRIQVTNASMKEKKSSKPIMDESETTSTETENLPKEKEFFDKGKISTARGNSLPKLRGQSKSKFSYSDFAEPDDSGNSSLFRRRRRKKKKFVQENPVKPNKDYIKFDTKTMENFLKKIMTDQNLEDQTTQKIPVSNHLPQVETVYNPTQGTNKAQLETTRFGKLNSGSNKNSASDKNNMPENEPNAFDDEILRSYLKDKADKVKSDQGKDYEDVEWKPNSGKMRLRQELGWDPGSVRLPNLKASIMDSMNSAPPTSYLTQCNQHIYGQKIQPPSSNYFYHPATSNVYNTNSLYDAVKLQQDLKSRNAMNEHSVSKLFKKPMHHTEQSYSKQVEKDKNTIYSGGEGVWNYEYSIPKKTSLQVYKNRDLYGIKNQNRLDSKNKLTPTGGRKFMMNFEEEKPPIIEPPASSPLLDNSKDSDYMDGIDDDYLDESDTSKDSPLDDSLTSATRRKTSKPFETPGFHQLYNYKNSDFDDTMNEDDEEVDEDYDENSEDDDFDDYSLLTNTKATDPEIMKNGHGKSNFDSSFQPNTALSPLNYVLPKDNLQELRGHSFEQTEFTDPRSETKFTQGKQFPTGDVKAELDSISTSSALLKKVNENSNILEKNMMKSGFGYNYDDNFTNQEYFSEKIKDNNNRLHHNKLTKRRLDMQKKFKRSREYPQIGSRLFYAAKTEINPYSYPSPNANSNLVTLDLSKFPNNRNSRHTFYRRHPLYAEFADPDNGFENDSEENGEQFNGNLANLGKNSEEEKNKEKVEETELSDVAENLEDDGETISEDNVLENVIGKYIMRKRVASPTELNKAFESSLKKEEVESESKHKLNKRSSVKQKRWEKISPFVKVVSKRLSSGHLTENNFRKYHKKNLNKKRQAVLLDFGTDADTEEGIRKTKKRGNLSLSKRSALNLFKKITNKDRDNKKLENIDGHTAGFEPLSSLTDKKYESSIRDLKLEQQDKTLWSESPENHFQNSLTQFKTRYPSEISLVVGQQKKEKTKESLGSLAQGPWKIELNDDSEMTKFSGKKDYSENVKASGAPPTEEGLKAFLVFSTRPRVGKRSPGEESPPASGSLQKEVGNSYRPKSGKSRRIFKRHVRKRSLDSSVVTATHEDAAQGRFAEEQTTKNHVSLEERNRALHNTMSLFTSQPSRVLQRNSKKIRSFVSADEQCQTARFPPKGRLNKRQSVFPPSNDANNILVKSEKVQPWRKINKRLTNPSQIMRDSRHVNEETSKYLGEQIVDAILSHVRANPKFKELIAPGLPARTTAYKEDIDIKQRPVHQADVSQQLQLFLQKFIYDLEKLAEKRVQKRMCNEIDPQSRQFLESLLRVPTNTPDTKNTCNEKLCSGDNTELGEPSDIGGCTTETSSTEPPTTCIQSLASQEQELDNLKKKHGILLQLIEDYEKLTKLEKESLRVNYGKLVKELQATRSQLESQNYDDFCSKNNSSETIGKIGSNDIEKTQTQEIIQGSCLSCEQCTEKPPPNAGNKTPSKSSDMENSEAKNVTEKPKFVFHSSSFDDDILKNSGSEETNTTKVSSDVPPENDDSKKTHDLPTFFFDEDIKKNPRIPFSNLTKSPIFEKVESVNVSNSSQRSSKTENKTKGGLQPGKNEASLHTLQTPQSFDLLPCQNFTQKLNNSSTDQNPESVQIKESLSGSKTFENSDNGPSDLDILLRNRNRPTELHKLSLEDEIGLQLLLKKHGPLINTDAVKTVRNVPSQLHETILGPRKGRASRGTANDVPIAGNDQSSVAPSNENSLANVPNNYRCRTYAVMKPTPFLRKMSPFETVSKSYWDLDQIPLNFFLRKDARTTKKKNRSIFSAPFTVKRKPPRPKAFNKKVEKILPRFLPTSLKNKRKKSTGSGAVEKEVDDSAALEFQTWSNMPAVRRQMNNLERGFELDEFFSQDPKGKKT